MTLNLTTHQARLLHMRAQLLASPIQQVTAGQLLTKLFAVQAQNLGAAYQSLGVRSRGLSEAQISQERQFGTEICWRWSLRGTLHLMTVEDARWFVPLMAEDLVNGDRLRLEQLGYNESTAKQGVELILSQLEKQGELTRAEIARLLQENKLPYEGQAIVHILFKTVCEAGVCPGADRGSKPTYTLFEKKYGPFKPRPREDALAELVLRYLAAYAPARPEDFTAWSGVKISEARSLWSALEKKLLPVEIEGVSNWMLLKQKSWLDGLEKQASVLRLLPYYDTYLLGYANRDLIIAKAYTGRVLKGGVIDAMLALDGWIIGTWKLKPRKSGLDLSLQFFEHQPKKIWPQIEAEVERLEQFMEKKVSLLTDED
ncbi:MAG TPA: winged helix DNA-binding domain-containing protein [Bellilinea sp.]|nr:winged helix DNA-binding domain-containing protein [Bellilinea sp.]